MVVLMQMRPLTFHLLLFPPPLHLMCAFSSPAVAWRSSLYCSLRSTAAAIKGLMGGLAAPTRIQSGRDRLQPVVQQQLRNERWRDKGGEGRGGVGQRGGLGQGGLSPLVLWYVSQARPLRPPVFLGSHPAPSVFLSTKGREGESTRKARFPAPSPLRSAQTHTPKDTGIHYGFLFPAFPLIVTGL